jgi:hypothetical protein
MAMIPRFFLIGLSPRCTTTIIIQSTTLPGENNNDINPPLNGVPGCSPMFVFPSDVGKSVALVRSCSLFLAPIVAKTAAIGVPYRWGLNTLKMEVSEFSIRPVYIHGRDPRPG